MSSDPIVPQRHSLIVPLDSDLQVLSMRDMLIQISLVSFHYFTLLYNPFFNFYEREDANHTVNSNFSRASDSSSFKPSIRFVNPGFTNRAFSPVAGCTRTIGCLDTTGARRTCFPSLAAPSACGYPECSARRPSSRRWTGGDKRSYAATWDTQAVSPPVAGTWSRVRMVMAGGWCS